MTTGYLLEFKSNVAVYLGRSGFGVAEDGTMVNGARACHYIKQ